MSFPVDYSLERFALGVNSARVYHVVRPGSCVGRPPAQIILIKKRAAQGRLRIRLRISFRRGVLARIEIRSKTNR